MVKLPVESFDPSHIGPGIKSSMVLTFATAEGVIGEIPLHVVKGEEDGPTLLILAAVHGDEYDGVQTVIQLCNSILPSHIRGTVMLVPTANALSYEGMLRNTPLDGRNLAREFPGKSDGSFTQRLAWHLDRSLLAKADFLLDYHSGGANFSIPPLVGYYHNENVECGRRSRAAAEAFGMETVWAHPEVNPGRTVSSATSRGIPWLYTEAFGGMHIRPEEQELYRMGAYRLMAHLGMLLQPELWMTGESQQISNRLIGDGNFDFAVCCEASGFFIPSARMLDEVREGEQIGTIHGTFGEVLQTVRSPMAGILIGIASMPKINKGDLVCSITQRFEG